MEQPLVPGTLINPLTAMKKNNPYANELFSGQNQTFFNYIHQRQNIPDARYQYSLGIYRRIYPAAGICNISAAPDISGSWRLRG